MLLEIEFLSINKQYNKLVFYFLKDLFDWGANWPLNYCAKSFIKGAHFGTDSFDTWQDQTVQNYIYKFLFQKA